MRPYTLITKADFARLLGVTPARVSQWVSRGLPEIYRGKLELDLALRWVKSNTKPDKSRYRDRGCHVVDSAFENFVRRDR